MAWLLLFVGAFLGAMTDRLSGLLFGAAIGYLMYADVIRFVIQGG